MESFSVKCENKAWFGGFLRRTCGDGKCQIVVLSNTQEDIECGASRGEIELVLRGDRPDGDKLHMWIGFSEKEALDLIETLGMALVLREGIRGGKALSDLVTQKLAVEIQLGDAERSG
jgi:hypothetical protein